MLHEKSKHGNTILYFTIPEKVIHGAIPEKVIHGRNGVFMRFFFDTLKSDTR